MDTVIFLVPQIQPEPQRVPFVPHGTLSSVLLEVCEVWADAGVEIHKQCMRLHVVSLRVSWQRTGLWASLKLLGGRTHRGR